MRFPSPFSARHISTVGDERAFQHITTQTCQQREGILTKGASSDSRQANASSRRSCRTKRSFYFFCGLFDGIRQCFTHRYTRKGPLLFHYHLISVASVFYVLFGGMGFLFICICATSRYTTSYRISGNLLQLLLNHFFLSSHDPIVGADLIQQSTFCHVCCLCFTAADHARYCTLVNVMHKAPRVIVPYSRPPSSLEGLARVLVTNRLSTPKNLLAL
jgi:hypothetical protein